MSVLDRSHQIRWISFADVSTRQLCTRSSRKHTRWDWPSMAGMRRAALARHHDHRVRQETRRSYATAQHRPSVHRGIFARAGQHDFPRPAERERQRHQHLRHARCRRSSVATRTRAACARPTRRKSSRSVMRARRSRAAPWRNCRKARRRRNRPSGAAPGRRSAAAAC